MLRPTNQFEALMKDTRFAQQFPIDNEDAIETYVTVKSLFLTCQYFCFDENKIHLSLFLCMGVC